LGDGAFVELVIEAELVRVSIMEDGDTLAILPGNPLAVSALMHEVEVSGVLLQVGEQGVFSKL
jgi:hypothetical protein